MEKGIFVDTVMTALPLVRGDHVTIRGLRLTVTNLFKRGFSVEDATAYMLCLEEVSPDLDEDMALAKMHELWIKNGQPANEAHSF